MGLGQTLLTIMALMLMGRLILSVNSTTLDVGFTKDIAEYRIAATSLGTSMLEEVSSQNYDEKTLDSVITLVTNLTTAGFLGRDNGEATGAVQDFDDIDDYDNYERLDTLDNSVIYKTKVTVKYVMVSGADIVVSTTQQFNKQISVFVTSNYLVDYSVTPPQADTLKFQEIFSYWSFR